MNDTRCQSWHPDEQTQCGRFEGHAGAHSSPEPGDAARDLDRLWAEWGRSRSSLIARLLRAAW